MAEIYGAEKTARAIEDALEFQAFSGEYIANLLEQRQRLLPDPGALHLTRRQDLLELELPEPNLGIYETQLGEAQVGEPQLDPSPLCESQIEEPEVDEPQVEEIHENLTLAPGDTHES